METKEIKLGFGLKATLTIDGDATALPLREIKVDEKNHKLASTIGGPELKRGSTK